MCNNFNPDHDQNMCMTQFANTIYKASLVTHEAD